MERFTSLVRRLGPHLERVQGIAVVVAGVAFVLGFLASIDVLLFPRGPESAAWLLHPLLLVLGAAAGGTTAVRGRQIDKKRWELVEDPLLTDGERELAHREAERERRWAGTVFFVVPIFLGYWMAYQFRGTGGGTPATSLLIGTPMVGFLLGLFLTQRALGPEERPY